jgi:hypothetical protein
VIRQGRGGVGNYKHKGNSKSISSNSAAQRNQATGYFVRNPNTPLLLSFNNPNTGAEKHNDHRQGDRVWNRFLASNNVQEQDRKRYMRVNPELFSELPKFADVSKMEDLERDTLEVIRQNPSMILEATHRLVASTFFFERDASSIKQTASGFTCTGTTHSYATVLQIIQFRFVVELMSLPRVHILSIPPGLIRTSSFGLVYGVAHGG